MDATKYPTQVQREFFERHVLGEEATILSLKVVRGERRGFSVNVRGPFKLAEYKFTETETVIDASWAGPPESNSHLHCCWTEIQFAKLTPTTDAVKKNIKYEWQLSFFATRAAAEAYDPEKPETDLRLFWFYLETGYHKAVQTLQHGVVIAVA